MTNENTQELEFTPLEFETRHLKDDGILSFDQNLLRWSLKPFKWLSILGSSGLEFTPLEFETC